MSKGSKPKKGGRSKDALTAKQLLFVKEFLIDLNASAAARRAGYSQNHSDTVGPRMIQIPKIKAAIDRAKGKQLERLEVTADKVVQELAQLGFAPLGAAFVSTAEKKAALDSLARHLGLFKDRVDLGGEMKTEVKITFV